MCVYIEISKIMLVESGKLLRTRMSAPDEEKEGIMKAGIDKIKANSIVVDEILPGTHATGLFHNFEAGATAFATITSSGPSKIWCIPGDKFRAVVTKPEFSILMMATMAKTVRTYKKSMRGLLDKIQDSGISDVEKGIHILSYDATSWVIDNFNVAIKKFNSENDFKLIMEYTTDRLSSKSASYAAGFDVVCLFVNDTADAETIQILSNGGVKMVRIIIHSPVYMMFFFFFFFFQ